MTTNWSKRLLALVLCLCMMLPGTVFAETVEQPVIEIIEETSETAPAEETVDEPTEEPVEEPAEEPAEEIIEEPADEPVIEPETDASDDESGVNPSGNITITTQPKNVTAANGATASVTVEATGSGLSYAWYFAEKGSSTFSKSNVTSSTYSVTMNADRNGRRVFCEITDSEGDMAMTDIVTLSMGSSLTITKQPTNVKVLSGQTAKTTVTASGEGLTYTWYFKDAGATKYSKSTSVTTNTYSTTMNADRAGRYVYCVVKDKYGNEVRSNTVVLQMGVAAKITKQPTSVTVANGATAKTTVTATGDGLTYTWYFKNAGDSTFMKGSITTNTYSVKMDSSRAGRQVYCIVKDQYGTTLISNTVTLNMSSGLKITQQPAHVRVLNGQVASTTVTATGEGLTYTWYCKDAGTTSYYKSGTKTNTYSVVMNADRAGRYVYCVVADKYGNKVQSTTAALNMATAAKITKQPTNVIAANGTIVNTSVTATGDGLTYAWYYKNAGENTFTKGSSTTNTYSMKMDSSRAGRQVYCIVKDKYGTTLISSTVTLSMTAGVTITKEPASVKVLEGQTATVSVTASGEGLTYQWYFKDAGATKYSKSASATTNTYSTVMNADRAGRYLYCVVTDKNGVSVRSKTVALQMGTAAKITAQPVSVSAANGDTINISVTAVGDGLTYEWYYQDLYEAEFVKSTITTNTYTTYMSDERNGRSVYCVVTDQYGTSEISNTATMVMETDANSFTYSISNGAVTIKSYIGSSRIVAIPSKIEGYPVTAIGYEAFRNNDNITAITLPSTLTSIGNYAFYDCGALSSISIPGSVGTISYYCFRNCDALRSVSIGTGVKVIDSYAFYDCDALSSISIPGSVTTIGGDAFAECSALGKVTLTNGSSLKLNDYAFYNCDLLTSISIPASVTSIGYKCFYDCDALKTVTLVSGLTSIGSYAFQDCSVLTSISIPATVGTISNSCFRNCDALKTVTIAGGVKVIDSYAFYDCDALTSITIPGTVTTIGSCSFKESSALTKLNIIKGSDVAIGSEAFYNCDALSSVTLPTSVTGIGAYAFDDCDVLPSISIPGSVATIGNYAFQNCAKLATVSLGSGILHINLSAFRGCIALKSISIPASVISIGDNAFYGCTAMATLTIANGPTSIGSSAFYNCDALTSVTTPASVTSIGGYAFYNCNKLATVKISSGTTSVGSYAFNNCDALTSVTIPATVTSLGDYCFYDCDALKTITVPEGTSTIGYAIFRYCDALATVKLPSTLVNIGNYAFNNCPKVTVQVPSGSTAHSWCVNNSIPYKTY